MAVDLKTDHINKNLIKDGSTKINIGSISLIPRFSPQDRCTSSGCRKVPVMSCKIQKKTSRLVHKIILREMDFLLACPAFCEGCYLIKLSIFKIRSISRGDLYQPLQIYPLSVSLLLKVRSLSAYRTLGSLVMVFLKVTKVIFFMTLT